MRYKNFKEVEEGSLYEVPCCINTAKTIDIIFAKYIPYEHNGLVGLKLEHDGLRVYDLLAVIQDKLVKMNQHNPVVELSAAARKVQEALNLLDKCHRKVI